MVNTSGLELTAVSLPAAPLLTRGQSAGSPAASSLSPMEREMEAGAGHTVIFTERLRRLKVVTVMVALPGATAVTLPAASTVATAALLEEKV